MASFADVADLARLGFFPFFVIYLLAYPSSLNLLGTPSFDRIFLRISFFFLLGEEVHPFG